MTQPEPSSPWPECVGAKRKRRTTKSYWGFTLTPASPRGSSAARPADAASADKPAAPAAPGPHGGTAAETHTGTQQSHHCPLAEPGPPLWSANDDTACLVPGQRLRGEWWAQLTYLGWFSLPKTTCSPLPTPGPGRRGFHGGYSHSDCTQPSLFLLYIYLNTQFCQGPVYSEVGKQPRKVAPDLALGLGEGWEASSTLPYESHRWTERAGQQKPLHGGRLSRVCRHFCQSLIIHHTGYLALGTPSRASTMRSRGGEDRQA